VATPTLQTIQANGLRFAYLEEGSGPLVLLLHGFPDTPQTWDATRPALAAAGFRAVTPFTRGYAPTEIPAGEAYDPETLGRDAIALIEALGEEKAFLVGHDWGASAAFSAAGLAPERLRMLITVAIPHPASILPMPSMIWAARHFFSLSRAGAAGWIRAGDYAHIDELVHRWSPGWDVPPGETDAVKEAVPQPGCLEAALGYYRALRPWLPPRSEGRCACPRPRSRDDRHRGAVGVREGALPLHRPLRGGDDAGGHFMHASTRRCSSKAAATAGGRTRAP